MGPRYYRAYTHHPTVICRLAGGAIGHMPPYVDRLLYPEILICVLREGSRESVWFTNSTDERPLSLGREPWSADFFAMRRLRLTQDRCAFAHPYSGRLLVALPGPAGEEVFQCAVSRWREPGDWETFRLEEVTLAEIHSQPRAAKAAEILSAAQSKQLGDLLASDCPAPDLEAIARLKPQREWERLAERMLSDGSLAKSLLSQAGSDPMAVGMVNLLAARSGMPRASIDRKNDGRFASLSTHSPDGTYTSLTHKLTSTARRQWRPSRRLCALATARNEGPYLLEWIAYHRVIGVEHFFLYTNDNDDGSDALLRSLHDGGILTWTENIDAGKDIQAKAYGHALTIEPDIVDYDWVAVLDIDEFIALKPNGFCTLPDYLAWQENQPVDVVSLSWAVFWSNGQVLWSDDLSITRFNRQNAVSALGKSIFRPGRFTYSYPHHPAGADASQAVVVRDSLGSQVIHPRGELTAHEAGRGVFGEAWVNHYFSRSAEEFLWKWSRGRGDGTTIGSFAAVPLEFMEDFMRHHPSSQMDVPDGVTWIASEVRREMDALRQLPGVAAAEQNIIDIRQARAALTRNAVERIDREGLSQAHLEFLRLFS